MLEMYVAIGIVFRAKRGIGRIEESFRAAGASS
jgi:hypothetical protein